MDTFIKPYTPIVIWQKEICRLHLSGTWFWKCTCNILFLFDLYFEKYNFRWDEQYKTFVSTQYSCDLIPFNTQFGAFNPGRNITEGQFINSSSVANNFMQCIVSLTLLGSSIFISGTIFITQSLNGYKFAIICVAAFNYTLLTQLAKASLDKVGAVLVDKVHVF